MRRFSVTQAPGRICSLLSYSLPMEGITMRRIFMPSTTRTFAALAVLGLVFAACDQPPTEPGGLHESEELTVAPNITPEPGIETLGETPGAPLPRFSIVAASPGNVLIYGPSMSAPNAFRPQNEQTLAVAAGHTVTVASAASWAGMTTAHFAAFDAIVFGDRTCTSIGVTATANANKATWSAAVNGPMYVQGSDPQWHQFQAAPIGPETLQMIASGINFAASRPGSTGLYVSLSCYGAQNPVSFLTGVGNFVTGPQSGCPGIVNIVDPTHPSMAALTNAGLSNWGCSPHEFLLTFPASFKVMAEAVRPSDSAVLPFIIATPAIIQVDIDIKPGSDPNSINCNNEKKVVGVAILTTGDFDATTVDHTTVTFEGASETHMDKKTGLPRRHEEDVDGDGDTDLLLHFRLGDTGLTCSDTEGTLIGETFGGDPIEGVDAVRMVEGGNP